jgi:hypothetical protein
VFEPIAFFTGDRNDFYAIQQIVGPFAIWSFILIAIGLAVYSISSTLSHFVSHSKHRIGENADDTKHTIVGKEEKNEYKHHSFKKARHESSTRDPVDHGHDV